MMQTNSSVSDKKQALLKGHFSNKVPFFFTIDFLLVLSSSLFSNDIPWIRFSEHLTGANYDLVSKETGSWVA